MVGRWLVSFWDGDTWPVRTVSFRECKWINALKIPFLIDMIHGSFVTFPIGSMGLVYLPTCKCGLVEAWCWFFVQNSPRNVSHKSILTWWHVRNKNNMICIINEIVFEIFDIAMINYILSSYESCEISGGYNKSPIPKKSPKKIRSFRATQQKELRRPRPPVSSRPVEVAMVESKKVELFPPDKVGWLMVARWWFQIFLIFPPILGEKIPNLTSIFFTWVGSTTNQVG